LGKPRRFEEWAGIVADSARVAPSQVVLHTLTRLGADAGIRLTVAGEQSDLSHRWLLLVVPGLTRENLARFVNRPLSNSCFCTRRNITVRGAVMRSVLSLAFALSLLFIQGARAEGQATPDEAKQMAVKAAAYLKSVGPEKAFAEFAAKEGPWHDRDLYVTVEDSKGVMVMHGTNPGLIGKSMLDLKDVDGKPFNREIQAITDQAWVNYKWQNPTTKAVEAKSTYEVRVGEYLVGVGAYAK